MMQHIGKIEHINIFWDPDSDKREIMFAVNGNMSIPAGCFMINEKEDICEGISEDTLNSHNLSKHKFEDYNFAVGGFSTLGPYEKIINIIKNKK